MDEPTGDASQPVGLHLRTYPALARAATTCACLLVIAAAGWVLLEVLDRLSLVLFPVTVAAILTRVLVVPSEYLRKRGWRPAPRAATVLGGFLLVVVALVTSIATPMVSEFSHLGDTVEVGIDDIKEWVIEDSGWDVSRADVEEFEQRARRQVAEAFEGSEDRAIDSIRLAIELAAGLLLALVLTFFAIKDGPRFQTWAYGLAPEHRRSELGRMAAAGWAALGGYLRASALLGVLEAAIIGAAMLIAGADLVLPVMLLTFSAAFIPLVGATVAGVTAVLVTLASAGLGPAAAIAVVALLVQQFDNELLAPWLYGKNLELHPAVILLSIATGTAAFGFVGTILAVPITATFVAIVGIRRRGPDGDDPADDDGGGGNEVAPAGGPGTAG